MNRTRKTSCLTTNVTCYLIFVFISKTWFGSFCKRTADVLVVSITLLYLKWSKVVDESTDLVFAVSWLVNTIYQWCNGWHTLVRWSSWLRVMIDWFFLRMLSHESYIPILLSTANSSLLWWLLTVVLKFVTHM